MQTAHGRPSPEEKFEIVGFTDRVLIGFSVLWKTESKHYRSVTSWSGRYFEEGPGGAHPEGEDIDASWHLCRMHSDKEMKSENEVWESYLSGKSLFRLASR